MIKEISDFSIFILYQPQFTLDLKKEIDNIMQNNKDIESVVNNPTVKIVNDFVQEQNEEIKFACGKKIIVIILDIIKTIHQEKLYDFSRQQAQLLFSTLMKHFNLFSFLFKNESTDKLLELFSNVYFNFREIDQNELIKDINELYDLIESYNLEDNEFLQSVYIVLLRIIMSRRLILLDSVLTEKISNIITSKGIQESFIEPYEH